MGSLAQFVMSGRKQAILASVLLGLVPLFNLLGPVVVGLVTLRKGVTEGLVVFAWAVLPLAGWAYVGDIVPVIMLLGILGLATLLRETGSWEFTLLAAIAVGAGVEIYLRLQPGLIELMLAQFEEVLRQGQVENFDMAMFRESMFSFIAAVYMCLAILLLMLARWLQARLYNPGGFQQEFHRLRMEQKVAGVLVVLMLLIEFSGIVPSNWVVYLMLPLVFSGLALVHGVVAIKKLSGMVLVVLYAMVMFRPVLLLVVMLAIVDSWYDFRARLANSGPPVE